MEDELDTCPKCECADVEYLGAYNVRCEECGHEWNLRELHGLSPTHCETCNRSLSWGCGHDDRDERASVLHRCSAAHLLGECDCYVSRPGYAAHRTGLQRREAIAALLLEVESAPSSVVFTAGALQEKLLEKIVDEDGNVLA